MADQKSTRTPTRIGWLIVLSIAMLAGFICAYTHGTTWSAARGFMDEPNEHMALEATRVALIVLGIINGVAALPVLLGFSDECDFPGACNIIPFLLREEIELWHILLLLVLLPAAVLLAAMHVMHPCIKGFFKWLDRTAKRVLTIKVMKRK